MVFPENAFVVVFPHGYFETLMGFSVKEIKNKQMNNYNSHDSNVQRSK